MTLDPTTLRALLAAATPRPWRHERPDSGYDGPEIIGASQEPGDNIAAGSWCIGDGYGSDSHLTEANADLITAAVNALPDLLRVAESVGAFHDASRDGTSTDAYTARERLFDLVRELGLSPTDRALSHTRHGGQ